MKRESRKKSTGFSFKALRAEWRDWYLAKKPVLDFALKFGGLIALLYVLEAIPFFDQALNAYLKANAWLANIILNVLGQHSQVSEYIITSPRFSMAIRRGCDAVEPTWYLCAAILAFPGPLARKALGMAAGIVILQTLNLVRIVTLYWIGIHWGSTFFNSAHVEIWPVIFILVALFIFVAWKSWSQSTRRFDAA